MTREEIQHTTIDDISPLGRELSEDELALAAGGTTVYVGTYSCNACYLDAVIHLC